MIPEIINTSEMTMAVTGRFMKCIGNHAVASVYSIHGISESQIPIPDQYFVLPLFLLFPSIHHDAPAASQVFPFHEPCNHHIQYRHDKYGQGGGGQHSPNTVNPMVLRATAPAPVANTSGSTPKINAMEVMMIGRKRKLHRIQVWTGSVLRPDQPALWQTLRSKWHFWPQGRSG